jgi:iduronate 2-sulfatase
VIREPSARVRDHAYHVFPRAKLGRAIRTEQYRLVEWKKVDEPPEAAELELYDYEIDPLETRNVARERPEVVKDLRTMLDRHPMPLRP